MEFPGFMFDPEAWLSSANVHLMDAVEERGYLRLLLYEWQQPDCGLPDDDESLARWALISISRWRRSSGAKLRRCFVARNGRLYNERLLRELHRQQEEREFLHSRAKAGAAARWGNKGAAGPEDETSNDASNTGSGVSDSLAVNDSLGSTDPMLKHSKHPYVRTYERSSNERTNERNGSVSEIEILRASLAAYMEPTGAGSPDDELVSRVLEAAGGATALEINEFLSDKYVTQPPGSRHGPRGWGWFISVVKRNFADGADRRDSTTRKAG